MSHHGPAIKTVIIAATHSGAGKTTVALGLMAVLKRRGLRVAPFKVGPDYIDPGHHKCVSGGTSRNLDGWMLDRETNQAIFSFHCHDADIAVVEGVMGLFDGVDGQSEAGSTAQIAKWLQAPVLLVVDASSMARSAAALVQGFENFDGDVSFAGALFNRLGSDDHLDYVHAALEGYVRMPCLGGFLRDDEIVLPERHLGLLTTEDHPLSEEWIEKMADIVESAMDVGAFINRLPSISISTISQNPEDNHRKSIVLIGWAFDHAFCFYYIDNLDLLRQEGAELVPFSPIADQTLPPDLDGMYFGGGYPELHAAKLADNEHLRHQVLSASQNGMPIYGECGGLMYLCESLADTHGDTHAMTACFPLQTRMYPHFLRLGYREVMLTRDSIIGPSGLTAKGHEFHYSELIVSQLSQTEYDAYNVTDCAGMDVPTKGYLLRRTLGSYIHLHFGSRPQMAAALIKNCRKYRQERQKSNESKGK